MEKERLYKLLDNVDNKKEAIEMIISNFIDVGTTHLGGCVSVKQFGKISECLIEWGEREEQPTSDKQNDILPRVSNSALIDYIENDAEIAMPIDEFFNEDGTPITKKKYGKVLLKYLVKELREHF